MIELQLKPNRGKLKLEEAIINSVGEDYKFAEEKLKIMKEVPQIYYYDVEFPMEYVKKLKIESTGYLPTMHVIFDDVYNILHDIGMPADNAKVTIVMPSKSDNLADIFLEFKITKFSVNSTQNNNKRIEMHGILNVENILIKNYESFNDKTSYDVCKDIAGEVGLGLMSNVTASNDKMTWINPGMNRYLFLANEVIKKAWISESSFVWSFVDFYYNINYIDIEKALSDDIDDIKWIAQVGSVEDGKILISPMLANDASMKETNIFFVGENIKNNSTEISILRGYLRDIFYYDVDGNWDKKAGSYKEYTLDTITTPDKDNTVYLKGDPGDTTFYKNNKSYHYLGKIDTQNMHPDYLWAEMQNMENIYDLEKLSMNIKMPNPNFNIKRFEKVSLTYSNNNVNATGKSRNFKLNGEWLVTGITFNWDGQNKYYQTITIVKRELTYNE